MRIDGSVLAALLKLIRDARQAEASGAPKILKTLTIPTTLGAASLRSPGVPGDRPSSLGCRFIAQVRAVAPDANSYLTLYSIFKTGIDGSTAEIDNLRQAHRYLPDNIQLAIEDFKASPWITEILGADVQGRFADLKQAAADRSPRELGTFVKGSEVQYHHEVYNQSLWNNF